MELSKINHSLIPWNIPFILCWNDRYNFAYDTFKSLDCNQRYSFFLMDDPNNIEKMDNLNRKRARNTCTTYDLLCFDKVNKGFFELMKGKDMDYNLHDQIRRLFMSDDRNCDKCYLKY